VSLPTEPTEPVEPPTDVPDGTVQTFGDPPNQWHLITYGTWQISVAPDGLLMLPRHLHPREWGDFQAAATLAAQVAEQVVADNQARAAGDDLTLPPAHVTLSQGGVPPGQARMTVSPGPNQPRPQRNRAAIGRPAPRNPQLPRTP
jgi:hypothetical protein